MNVMHMGGPAQGKEPHDPLVNDPDSLDALRAAQLEKESKPWKKPKGEGEEGEDEEARTRREDEERATRCKELAQLMDALVDPTIDEAKREEAFVRLQIGIVKKSPISRYIFPLALGRLLRKAKKEINICNEQKLVEVMLRKGYDGDLVLHYKNTLFYLLDSAEVVGEIKLQIIELFSLNNSSPDRVGILAKLKDVLLHNTEDKVRACAVYAFHTQMNHRYGNAQIFREMKQLCTFLWEANSYDKKEDEDPYDFDSNKNDNNDEEAEAERRKQATLEVIKQMFPLGPLAKLATAYFACCHLLNPPRAAIEHLINCLDDTNPLNDLWNSGPEGGNWVGSQRKLQKLDRAVPPEFRPLVIEALGEEKEDDDASMFPAHMRFFFAKNKNEVPVPASSEWKAGIAVINGLHELGGQIKNKTVLPLLLEKMKQTPNPEASNRYITTFLFLVCDEPFPEGLIPQELEPRVFASLNQMVGDEFATFWSHMDEAWEEFLAAVRKAEAEVEEARKKREQEEAKEPAGKKRKVDSDSDGEDEKEEDDEKNELLAKLPQPPALQRYGLPPTLSLMKTFLTTPLPPEMEGRKFIPDLTGLDDEDWANLSHAYGNATDVPGLLRALCSSSPSRVKGAMHALYGNCFHQGSRYPASKPAAKWIAHILQYERVIMKDQLVSYLTHLATGYPEGYLKLGFDEDYAEMYALDVYEEVERHTSQYIEMLLNPDTDLGIATELVRLLSLLPRKKNVTLPVLLDIMEKDDELLSMRAAAMTAASLLALPIDPSLPAEEKERQGQYLQRLVNFLQILLPPPFGAVPSLKDLCLDRAASKEKQKEEKEAEQHQRLPEELRALLATRLALPEKDSPAFNWLRLRAALAFIRLIINKLGTGLAERSHQYSYGKDAEAEEKAKNAEAERLEKLQKALQTEELAKWVPHIEPVLLSYMATPSEFDLEEEEEDDPFFREDLVRSFLKDSGLFDNEEAHIQQLLAAVRKATDPADAAQAAMNLINLTFRDSARVSGWSTSQQPETYDLTKYTPLQKEVLKAVADNESIWAAKKSGFAHQLQLCLDTSVQPTRNGLLAAFVEPPHPMTDD